MPGVKGMKVGSRVATDRQKMWQSMRIMRRFTQPDLARTAGAGLSNVRKFVQRLEAHGIIVKTGGFTGGRAGEFQGYRLGRDTGPLHPVRCDECGCNLSQPCGSEQVHE